MVDKNNKDLTDGSIININQSINGENIFLVLNLQKLDIRYYSDWHKKYEYDAQDLLKPDCINGDVNWEIVGNIADDNLYQRKQHIKTINDFIKELQAISPEKRELPLVTDCPNGLEVFPSIKMRWTNQFDIMQKGPDKMVITWRD